MSEKKPKTIRLPCEVFDDLVVSMVFEKIKDDADGLAAAIVCANALGIGLPDWARYELAARQLSTDFSDATRPRQKKVRRQMETFAKDLLRYQCVRSFDAPRSEDGNDRIERVFEEIEGLWFAPRDSSGLKKSYYRFQRRFGRRLAGNIADLLIATRMARVP